MLSRVGESAPRGAKRREALATVWGGFREVLGGLGGVWRGFSRVEGFTGVYGGFRGGLGGFRGRLARAATNPCSCGTREAREMLRPLVTADQP